MKQQWSMNIKVNFDNVPYSTLRWRHNGRNRQPHDCLLKHLFTHRSKKTSKLRVTGLYARNSQVTGEFPAQRDSDAENVSIWWIDAMLPLLYKFDVTDWVIL